MSKILARIQQTLASDSVTVIPLGEASLATRSSLVFIADQAMQRDMPGFEVMDFAGRYLVTGGTADISAELQSVYERAAGAAAERQFKRSARNWVKGMPVTDGQYPEEAKQLFARPPSLSGLKEVVLLLQNGVVYREAAPRGKERFHAQLATLEAVKRQSGTLAVLASNLGLQTSAPLPNARYVGVVLGISEEGVLQRVGRQTAVVHAPGALKGDLGAGQQISVRYRNGQAQQMDGKRSENAMER
ncbi:KfrB domain-containing protein [Chromobacterium vaccinii]|uniref:KfrB domain-containing protein n=1 Tax=Chromobacterium vaccinii TaxID=1108595 RepID=UPI003C790A47